MNYNVTNERIDERGFSLREIRFAGFVIEQLRSPFAGADGEFLPCRVRQGAVVVWSFDKHPDFKGLALLREVDDEFVIILATKRELYDVLPVFDLPDLKLVGGNWIGGRKLSKMVALKELLAEAEGLRPIWTKLENEMREALGEKAKQEYRLAQARKQAEEAAAARRARQGAKEARRAEITNRKRLFVYTTDGRRRHGYPVVGDEWLSLPTGTFCVSVESYDHATGAVGTVVESFVVQQSGQKKSRGAVAAVTLRAPSQKKELAKELVLDFKIVSIDDEPVGVILVEDMDAVRTLAESGLNHSALAMCPKAGDDGRFAVFALKEGKAVTVTEVTMT